MNGYLAGVLVTGSRTWRDVPAVHSALLEAWHDARQDGWPGIEVIDGQASGADSIAAAWAIEHHDQGVGHQPYPAHWETCAPDCPPGPGHRKKAYDRTWCPTAGHRRNAAMVGLEPLLVVAFLMSCTDPTCRKPQPHDTHGTTGCLTLARTAGIPVREVHPT